MIKIENIDVYGWEAAIRGMRNPRNSWDRSDTIFDGDKWCMGENDLKLMRNLSNSFNTHMKTSIVLPPHSSTLSVLKSSITNSLT